jgi:hypothetical protein
MRPIPQASPNDKATACQIQWLSRWCGEGDMNPHEIAPASTST